MDLNLVFQIVGYIGSILVVVSMLMTSMTKLRIINSVGCVFSIVFTAITQSWPILLMNSALLIINLVQLYRIYSKKNDYDIVDCGVESATLKHFVKKYHDIIEKENPKFKENVKNANYAKVIYCNDSVVSMLVGKKEDSNLDIYLDYVDVNSLSHPLFSHVLGSVKNDGIKNVVYAHGIPRYKKYYEKFYGEEKDGMYRITL